MSLTKDEKEFINGLLDEKETTLAKRDHNRLEVQKCKNQLNIEEDEEKRKELREFITIGADLVEMQTSRLMALSMRKIAEHIDADIDSVRYYEKSSQRQKTAWSKQT